MLIKIRCTLPLVIWWDSFYPEDKNDWTEYKSEINDKEILVKIGVSERPLMISTSENLSKKTFPAEILKLIFSYDLPEEIIKKLRSSTEDEDIKKFREEVTNIIQQLYSNLIDILRNHFGQYWISQKLIKDENTYNKAEWLDSGEWKRVFPKMIYFISQMRPKGISNENWIELGKLLNNGYEPDMIQVMVSNAWEHFETENYRMAIIESVTALEATLKQIDLQVFLNGDDFEISNKTIQNIVNEMKFSHSLRLFYEHFGKKIKLDYEDFKTCLSGIEIRNNIMHNKQPDVPRIKTKSIILAISTFISSLSNLNIVKHGYIAG